ncbi:MAG: hypothetical protein OXR67_02765 [Chloroflexota bacterium]|nr:hypothetical protein [Chloroflexota bacterium]
MLKSQRDSVVSRLSTGDRQDMRQVIAAIKEARGGSPDMAAAEGRITAREILAGWQGELPDQVRSALEATLVRDETGPKVGDFPADFNLKRLGSKEWVRLSDFRGKRPVALAFGSYT